MCGFPSPGCLGHCWPGPGGAEPSVGRECSGWCSERSSMGGDPWQQGRVPRLHTPFGASLLCSPLPFVCVCFPSQNCTAWAAVGPAPSFGAFNGRKQHWQPEWGVLVTCGLAAAVSSVRPEEALRKGSFRRFPGLWTGSLWSLQVTAGSEGSAGARCSHQEKEQAC